MPKKGKVTEGESKKGEVTTRRLLAWDFASPCTRENCSIHQDCPYKVEQASGSQPCGIEVQYLRSVSRPFFELIDKVQDPFVEQWVGLHLVPLYHQLVKLKKYERGLLSPIIKSHGTERVHSVYREIRGVIKAIREEWRHSGILQVALRAGYLKGVLIPKDTPAGQGDLEYHDGLYLE